MEQTPLPPLVSDGSKLHDIASKMKTLANEIEADRQRTREVVQALVDALATEEKMRRGYRFTHNGTTKLVSTAPSALALAQSRLQIEPKP